MKNIRQIISADGVGEIMNDIDLRSTDVIKMLPEQEFFAVLEEVKRGSFEVSGDLQGIEERLLSLALFCSGRSNYDATDLAVTGYAYDDETRRKLIKNAFRHDRIAMMMKAVLEVMIRERLDEWSQGSRILFTSHRKVVVLK